MVLLALPAITRMFFPFYGTFFSSYLSTQKGSHNSFISNPFCIVIRHTYFQHKTCILSFIFTFVQIKSMIDILYRNFFKNSSTWINIFHLLLFKGKRIFFVSSAFNCTYFVPTLLTCLTYFYEIISSTSSRIIFFNCSSVGVSNNTILSACFPIILSKVFRIPLPFPNKAFFSGAIFCNTV